MRIFASDGTEVFHYEGCSESSDEVRGEIVEVPFDGSNYLTIKLHTEHEGSHVTSQFCILEAGKGLYSGITIKHTFSRFLIIFITPRPSFLYFPKMKK